MANNPYVNKVEYGNQTVMDISDTTAEESDVAEGKTFYKGNGQRSVGTGNYYSPNDTTETDIDDADYFPFYDTSANSDNGAKRKSLWSNIKAKLKAYFDGIYISDISGKVDNSVVAPVESGATASRAYAIGEHFIKDGAFCTAIVAISSGGTFTLNTNYVAGVVDAKSVLNSKVLTSSHNLNNIKDYGVYSWASSSIPTNTPFTDSSGCMLVVKFATAGIFQIAYNANQIFTRIYAISTDTWTSWARIERPYIKAVTHTNASAVTIAPQTSESVALSTSENLTGYTLMGISAYNLYSGAAAIGLAAKAMNTSSIVIENLSSSSITIPKNAVTLSARYIRSS